MYISIKYFFPGTLITTFRLTLDKWQLDVAHKDKRDKIYSPGFMVSFIMNNNYYLDAIN